MAVDVLNYDRIISIGTIEHEAVSRSSSLFHVKLKFRSPAEMGEPGDLQL